MEEILYIQFRAQFVDLAGTPLPPTELELQFKISQLNTWETLQVEAQYEEGAYYATYEIPERLSTSLIGLRAFREIVGAGGMPDLRLTSPAQNDEGLRYVYAKFGTSTTEGQALNYEFQKVQILPEEKWEGLPFTKSGQGLCKEVFIFGNASGQAADDAIAQYEEQIRQLKLSLGAQGNELEYFRKKEEEYFQTQEELAQLQEAYEKLKADQEKLNQTLNEQQQQQLNDDEIAALQQQIKDQEEQIIALKGQLEALKKQLQDYEELIRALKEEKESLLEEKEAMSHELTDKAFMQETIQENVAEIDKLHQTIGTKDQEIASIQQNLAAATQLANDLQQQMDDTAIDQPSEGSKAVPAHQVYSNVLSEIQTAKEKSLGTGFKLANISVNLKTLVQQNESGLQFQTIDLASASNINSDMVSNIFMEVVDGDVDNTNQTTEGQEGLPSVLGLTETACRRRLQALGLKLRPVYEHAPDKTLGQAFKQSPQVGSPYQLNQEITVIFSKDIN